MNELIKFDKKNYRLHGDKNKRIIRKSLAELGAARSIVVDKENYIIAGNGVFEQAQELGLKTRIVESDGKELIVVKRTDIATDDEKRKLLALADNYASDTSEFDIDLIMSDFDVEELDLWEFETNFDDAELDESENNYSRKIEIPSYTPKGEKPIINELLSKGKTVNLIAEINKSNIPKDEKTFLIEAAQRHTIFDYEKIAEYYCHASKEMQDLMEKSALVIIDFDKAIENGFVKLTEEIKQNYLSDYDEQ